METILKNKQMRVQIGWLEGLLEYVKITSKFMEKELTPEERLTLLKAGIPELVGYASSAETLLKYK